MPEYYKKKISNIHWSLFFPTASYPVNHSISIQEYIFSVTASEKENSQATSISKGYMSFMFF